LTKPYSII